MELVKELIEEIKSLDIEKIDFDNKGVAKELFQKILNVVEVQAQEIRQLKAAYQQLKDENARLKGEKGKPNIAPSVPPREPKLPPTEEPKKWKKSSKEHQIEIDKVVLLEIKKEDLPEDAKLVDITSRVIQNARVVRENTEFRVCHYYSKSLNKHYYAKLPEEVQNTQFGPDLKAFIVGLYYAGRVTENKIHKFLKDIGTIISEGEISNILTKEMSEVFASEKKNILETGIRRAKYFQTDETGARHNGQNYYMHYFGNENFSTFFIERSKSKETIRKKIGLMDGVLINTPMVTDGAKQYNGIASIHGLCWVHEVRHYIKLKPYLDHYRAILEKFINEIWEFYDLLTRYKSNPDDDRLRQEITQNFESLFTRVTGYAELDKRIASTWMNRDKLLAVLDAPALPLHNNGSEIAVREGVIKRKISYGTRSELGKAAWENMLSILDTCRKLKVSFLEYIRDIYSKSFSMPRLADMIPRAG
jgi:hypothetical protein